MPMGDPHLLGAIDFRLASSCPQPELPQPHYGGRQTWKLQMLLAFTSAGCCCCGEAGLTTEGWGPEALQEGKVRCIPFYCLKKEHCSRRPALLITGKSMEVLAATI